jgi:hypothetical protein
MTLCGDKPTVDESTLNCLANNFADEPLPNQARRVGQHIELHPKIKETYLLFSNIITKKKHAIPLKGKGSN